MICLYCDDLFCLEEIKKLYMKSEYNINNEKLKMEVRGILLKDIMIV